jgi:MFS family permease
MSASAWRARTFSSLDNPNYRKFFIAQAISLTGTWMQSVAMAWLVLELTDSATWLGLTIALQFVPVLLLGPYGGVLIDRLDKRQLIIATNCAAALQALALGLLYQSHHATLTVVLFLTLLLGLTNVLDNPARQSFVREMVKDDQVRNAVSLNSVLVNVARAVGPALAGVVIAKVGVGACFFVNAASFLAVIFANSAMNTALLNPSEPVDRAPGQLREGLRYVRATPELLIPLLMMGVVGTLTYEFQVTLPSLAAQTFGTGAINFGLVTSAMGIGAIAGGLVSAGRSHFGIKPLTRAVFAFGVADLLVAVAPSIELASLALVTVGAASIWFLATGNATLQMSAVPEMRGRVMALWAVAFLGTTPIGGPIIGFIAQSWGARWALAVGAVSAIVAGLLGLSAQRRHARVSESAPIDHDPSHRTVIE